MRWQANGADTKKEAELVPAGTYVGEIKFADDDEKYQRVVVKMDLDDGRRVRFSIKQRMVKQSLKAIDREVGDGTHLEGEWMVGKRVEVDLDQWSPDDDPSKVYNTLQRISKATEKKPNAVTEDNIPF